MGWDKAGEPGMVKRLKRIVQLLELIRQGLAQQEMRRIEGMAKTARYFRGRGTDEPVV